MGLGGQVGTMGFKGAQGKIRGDGYVHYLDCGDGFTGVYVCQNLNRILHVCAFHRISSIRQ